MYFDTFRAIDWYVDDPLEPIEAPGDIAIKLETDGVAISAFTKNGCIGCGGFIYWDENNAEAWIRISKGGLRHRREGVRAIRGMFSILKNICSTDMFCWVDTEWLEAQRMVEWLGFTPTHECKKINDKLYFVWKLTHGNVDDDSRDGGICHGADATGCNDRAASRSTSLNS